MKVIITADREYDDEFIVKVVMSGLYATDHETTTFIEGGASGGDEIARDFVEEVKGADPLIEIESITEEAEWDRYGKSAGPIRNRKMYDSHRPDVVVAFHDDLEKSKGTKDMIMYAVQQGGVVYHVRRIHKPDFDTTA